ncbi:MAG: phosphate acyltransferase, partial [Acidobacteriota bacterium]|nr:phosphate acyltransferase [Acidobacteriota bacterium]
SIARPVLLARREVVVPVLLGMAKPVHVLQRGVEVEDIVNMAAIYVVDAQEVGEPDRQTDLPL